MLRIVSLIFWQRHDHTLGFMTIGRRIFTLRDSTSGDEIAKPSRSYLINVIRKTLTGWDRKLLSLPNPSCDENHNASVYCRINS